MLSSTIGKGEEVPLDEAAIRDITQMFRSEPSISSARESFLASTLSNPFTFSIPKMGLRSKKDMNLLIERHWMPWLRKVYDWTRMFGICPYYFKRKGESHQIPIVPDIEMGHIRVFLNHKTHETEYRWYWSHGMQQHHEKKMLWIITDRAPTIRGELKSVLMSVLPRYRTILVLRRALEKAATQNVNISHMLEYHPSAATAKNDDLTQMVANFGEKAAGLSKARQEIARANDIRVRTNELMNQVRHIHAQNIWGINGSRMERQKLTWTETPEEVLERMDTNLDKMVPLRPDFKYVSPARPTVVAELEKYQNAFDVDAAAAMGYAYELIRPTGSARTQNVEGGKRFVNERAKEGLNFFMNVAQTALVIAYEKQFQDGFADFHSWQINRQGGDQNIVAEMHPEIDVEVYMSTTPMVSYNEIKQMWLDGIMDKHDFAQHAFEINSLPTDKIHVRKTPDMMDPTIVGVKSAHPQKESPVEKKQTKKREEKLDEKALEGQKKKKQKPDTKADEEEEKSSK